MSHINIFGRIVGSKPGAPNKPFWANKRLAYKKFIHINSNIILAIVLAISISYCFVGCDLLLKFSNRHIERGREEDQQEARKGKLAILRRPRD